MATKSIGATGRDYSTLALWAAYVNALSLSAPEIGECYNDSEFTFSSKVTFGGWTGGSSTNTVTLRCASGQGFRDNANVLTNALRYNQSNGVGVSGSVGYDFMFAVTTANFIMDGLQCKTNATNQNGVLNCGTTVSVTVQNFIFQGPGRSGQPMLRCATGDLTVTFQNGVIIVTNSVGSGVYCSSGGTVTDLTVINSNASSAQGGIINSYAPRPLVKNCAVYGMGANDYIGTANASSTNNATDQASFGGTNYGGSGQTSLVGSTEWQSVTAGSEDLRVKSTSAKLKGNGATVGPSDDIAKQTRTAPYTIGCWQFVSATTNLIFLLNTTG